MPEKLNYSQVTLLDLLCKSTKNYPQRTAIVFDEQEITYSKLESLSNQFANALILMGIKNGSRVALFLPNIPQFLIAYFGTLKAGAVVTAISPMHREREVLYQLCDSEAEAIVTLDTLYPIVGAVRQKTSLRLVIVTNQEEYGQKKVQPQAFSNTRTFQQLIQEAKQTPYLVKVDPNLDLAALQYTGGTTGTPKAAMLTHSNLVSNALVFAEWINGKPARETFLTALPLFHIYGMTTSMTVPVSLAATMVLIPKFEPAKAIEAIERYRVTIFCGVPTMYQALLARPELANHDLSSVRVCISGSSPLPTQIQKRFMQVTGGLLAEGYGLTEASPVTHCSPVDVSMRTVKVGSIGLPLPGTEARIVDLETGEPMARGETGELEVKGPQVMKGYWKKPEETAAVLHDGWLLTGDVAHMDKEGYFYIIDRKKDLIKCKGYSVYPRELEDILYEHPAVKLCAVIGKSDQQAGEVPVAYVVLKEGMYMPAEELMNFVNGKVAAYKAIHKVEFRLDLPLSSAGKVLKRQLLGKQIPEPLRNV